MNNKQILSALLLGAFASACSPASQEAETKAKAEVTIITAEEWQKRQEDAARIEVERLRQASLDGEGKVFYNETSRSGSIRNEAKTSDMILLEKAGYYGFSSPRYTVDVRSAFICLERAGRSAAADVELACRPTEEITDPELRDQIELIEAADKEYQQRRTLEGPN